MSRGPRRNDAVILIALLAFLWRHPRLAGVLFILVVALGLLGIALLVIFHDYWQPAPPSPTAIETTNRGTEHDGEAPPPSTDQYIHLLMGNPSRATTDTTNRDNFLMKKPFFALSYNNTKGTPNWVSWCLKKSDIEPKLPREDNFHPDLDLPVGFKQVRPSDYNGSGFDRGHMCPNGDRASTREAADATFVMTNMIPQSPNCNQKGWADFEDYCRELVRRKQQTLYIVAGPAGQGGEGKEGPKRFIGPGEKITVPANCWKVVLALPDGMGDASDLKRVTKDARLIAVVMPNDQSVGHGWTKHRTSVKEVEKLTGYKFFDNVPADIIEPLKESGDE
jgi:endonuclease G